jgi:hypothetical protein
MPGRQFRSHLPGLVFGVVLALVGANPASALEADSVAAALVAAVAAGGNGSLAYDSAAISAGDTVTLSGVRLTVGDGSTLTGPALIVTGAELRPEGGFSAARISFDNATVVGRGDTATWTSAVLEDVIVPSPDEVRNHARLRFFASADVAGLLLSGEDFQTPVPVASLTVAMGAVADGASTNIALHASGVRFPPSIFANSVAGTIIGMLDYKEFVADITLDATYDSAADTVAIRSLAIDIPDAGKITLAAKASGFSLHGIADPDREKAKAARANARLETLRVRLDNEGFVERMLDMQAGLLGGTRDDVRAQLVFGALPFALSFVQNEAFRIQFQAAVSTFLADPKSLTITATPDTPVPLGQVMRTASHTPAALPDLLAPTVEANN